LVSQGFQEKEFKSLRPLVKCASKHIRVEGSGLPSHTHMLHYPST
jgi:hypothetical protein